MFVGPILGGVFTDDITWRWCFYINLPIIAVAVAGIIIVLENPEALRTKKTFLQRLNELDYVGPIFFIPSIVCLVLALQLGGIKFAWNSPPMIILFSGFATLFLVWVFTQYRLGEKATIPFRVLFQRTVFFSTLFSFFTGAAMNVLTFYIPIYLQAILGSSATESGIQLLPLILSSTIASIVAGIIVTIKGYYTPIMILGMAEFLIGAGLLTTLGVNTPFARIIGFQILAGVGAGLNLQVLP
jgi:MFS family permease